MSAKHLMPEVNAAVERLLELADRMKYEEFGFLDKDVVNIDKVIDSMHELEKERRGAHDLLETETIHASILRHKLQFLPPQIKSEIKEAVYSARQDNAEALDNLKKKLESINNNIKYLEERQHDLEGDYSTLLPERISASKEHEDIIQELNEKMAEKAGLQIVLNETRDQVRQTNQNIVDLEDGILQLKEDLIHERTEARHEKKKLKQLVSDTNSKTKMQKEENVVMKKELDLIHEKLVDNEGQLDAVRKSLQTYEDSKAKLEAEERQLSEQLANKLRQNEALRKKGVAIINEDMKLQKQYEDTEKLLLKKFKKLEAETQREDDRNYELEGQKLELHSDLEEKMIQRQEDYEEVKALDGDLQDEKRELGMKAEEVGRMQAENVEMADTIESLAESHKAVLAQLNQQIEEFREQLNKERKERQMIEKRMEEKDRQKKKFESLGMNVQNQKNNVSKDIEEMKIENHTFLTQMNTQIQDGKVQHLELTNEGTSLQKELKEDEKEITNLEGNLTKAQDDYQNMFDAMQYKVARYEQEITEMERAIIDRNNQIEEKTPAYEDLEKFFENRTNEYDVLKRSIAKMRQKKSQLEDSIHKDTMKKQQMQEPREKLKKDLKKKRDEAIFQLKRHGEDRQKLEKDIYIAGCKLRSVLEENHKFEEGCDYLRKEIEDIHQQMIDNENIKNKLGLRLQESKGHLVESWDVDNQIQENFAEKDKEVLELFGEILGRTDERRDKITEISSRLEDELLMLGGFLDNLSTRRPKGKKKVTLKDTPVGSRHPHNTGSRSVSRTSRRDPLDHMSKRPETSDGRFSALEARANQEERDLMVTPSIQDKYSRPPTVASGKVVTISDVKDNEATK
ncbi:coiled-coil domain-containing protein 175-like isoform X3 [Mytilus californianus]|uniref:coiled-coil domain-containing protein 175-like isoform X3 n=1 Tax=Mytilus californianus TaxID=6549 RepID=UPI0022472ABA|nr:coiled-coil domain-containing protein 175-like isoform X3 [Mytilus californianus]